MADRREGYICSCCDQYVKEYLRTVNVKQALVLIRMARLAGPYLLEQGGGDLGRFVHVPSLEGCKGDGCEISRLEYWGLIAEERVRRPDGGRAGWWAITRRGLGYVRGHVTIAKYAIVYNGRCLGLEGDQQDIRDALGNKFDLAELMGWDTRPPAQPAQPGLWS